MPEPGNEILQCCDESGTPTFGKTRAEVHTQPINFWHLTTGIYVVNPEGRILCSKRSEKLNQNPGRWQMAFGGHVKYKQAPVENAVAELEEEIGLKVLPEDLYYLDTRKNPNFKHFSWLYAYVFDGRRSEIKFNDGEIEKVEWYTWSEVKNDCRLIPNLRIIIPLLHTEIKGWRILDQESSVGVNCHKISVELPIDVPFVNGEKCVN